MSTLAVLRIRRTWQAEEFRKLFFPQTTMRVLSLSSLLLEQVGDSTLLLNWPQTHQVTLIVLKAKRGQMFITIEQYNQHLNSICYATSSRLYSSTHTYMQTHTHTPSLSVTSDWSVVCSPILAVMRKTNSNRCLFSRVFDDVGLSFNTQTVHQQLVCVCEHLN